MKAHFSRYAGAYFSGILFGLWQFMIAFNAAAKAITPAQMAQMGRFEWAQFYGGVLIACIPVILAFLNQSVARGNNARLPIKDQELKGFAARQPDTQSPPLATLTPWWKRLLRSS